MNKIDYDHVSNLEENDNDDEELTPSTLAALQEFQNELQVKEVNRLFFELTPSVKADTPPEECNNGDNPLEEDWQLSQFWYDQKTIDHITRVAIGSTQNNDKIALLSCPSLYRNMHNYVVKTNKSREIKLFEFDRRFGAITSDFIFYDYKNPLEIPQEFKKYFDLVICDPPFLAEECLSKFSEIIQFLSKDKIIICTGDIMSDLVDTLLKAKKCKFIPRHKNNLANEFSCYATFNFDEYL